MHFLDAWAELSLLDLVRLLGPPGLLVAAAFLPGRRVARVAALGVAAVLPWIRELAIPAWMTIGWMALWGLLVLLPGTADDGARRPLANSRGVLESSTVGLLLGLALALLLVMAVARQDMSPEETRRASLGVVLISAGLLHLMLRRHMRRALIGFAALGLGLQVLSGAARGAQVNPDPQAVAGVFLATAVAVVLGLRIAAGRERSVGTAWVNDAHDLHD